MKKVQVIWTDESLGDLEAIYDFLVAKSPQAAKKVAISILARTRQLETFPES
ncbi:type II toxin-antitoxin system RelE/ParE family toxin [Cyclobacterium plantarum]|uniref:Type II toxin-antitoxin system RelE/ParE family toxin n=1 Tax=Cyclobacterium plantarum TaxID=2716263 RepID=A0ABX0HEH4_9BACT|nr:type II toxin-antitoxin system RelE/ParE family toxin [Cyclobacterium plantarum]NHE58744.1 type II toxin-antitoxin system RelE/ParE family toxin [Cyclobacterium plantarum]